MSEKALATPKVRDSNIELYRIISMLLIIAHHYVVNSGLTSVLYDNPTSPKSLMLFILGAFGKTGINCFVLITGYFMCTSQISAKKFAKLFLEVMFYRVVIYIVFWITSYRPFSLDSLFSILIPFRNVAQNFTGTFLLFYLFIPFLNKLIHSLNEKQHLLLVLLSGFVYIFFGTAPAYSISMNYVSWYMVLFVIASYLRLYPKNWFSNNWIWGLLTVLFVALAIVSIVSGAYTLEETGKKQVYSYVTDSNTFLAVAIGVCSFMFFRNVKIKPSRFINTISASCFGVLLIHAHSSAMRTWLWKDTLDNIGAYKSSHTLIHALLSVIGIFVICSIIDILRIRFIEKPFFKLWDKHWGSLIAKCKNIKTTIFAKVKNPQ